MNKKEIVKTDGKRRISVSDPKSKFTDPEHVEISFCNNGSHQTIVSIDLEMLSWLKEAINEYLR